MNFKNSLSILLIFSSYFVFSQEKLTKIEAVKSALDNNYGIKIADNNLKIAKNNKGLLNTNYLPTLTGNAGATFNSDNTDAVFSNGTNTSLNSAKSSRYNSSVSLNYTLFDGLSRHYNYKQLVEKYNLTELQARETIELTILQLFTVYYNVAQLTENVSLLKQNLKISKDRLKRVQYQFEFGQNTKLSVLNAEVDVNNDSINFLNTNQLLLNAKHDLYVVMGKNESPEFSVETQVSFLNMENKDDLFAQLKSKNVNLLQNNRAIKISDFQLKANQSGYLPTIGLTSTYGWTKSNNNSASFLQKSTNLGLSNGFNLKWDLFNGGKTNTLVKNAKINYETQQYLKQQAELKIFNEFYKAWDDYHTKLFVFQTQEKNVQTNSLNFKRTEEQYQLGQVNSIEFRQAQLNLLNAQSNLNKTKYDAKNAELILLQLTGNLLNTPF
ncbi:MAG: transporter [Flavobacteriales bacterium CG_4_10_14_0_2_um_filter_35_18]|nr:MAG: transporter [Flavobacteriales bacterium CG_4_10_14_0_2_um_filter_35_18]